jgi:hypothetical protein
MQSQTHVPARNRWAGRLIGWIPAFFLLFDSVIKIMLIEPVLQSFNELGYSTTLARPIGVVELICTILYLVPKTSVTGAVLLTGFLGGATAVKLRMEDPWFLFSVGIGVLLWVGIFMQNQRLRTFFFSKQ